MDGDTPGGAGVPIESALLGVTNWWLGKHSREEVIVLVSRHFRPEEVFQENLLMAQACQLQVPSKHKNSPLRSAGEAYIVDLVNSMSMLASGGQPPRFLVPSDQLGKVPLGALSIRDEVSVSARLVSLEESMKKVCAVLERGQTSQSAAVISRLEQLEECTRNLSTKVGQAARFPVPTFASVLAGGSSSVPDISVTPPEQQGRALPVEQGDPGASVVGGAGALGTGARGGNQIRARTRSTSQKRKADDSNAEGSDTGFKFQGRPRNRKVASGSSQVVVEGVGEYIAPAEFYIGNTDSRTNENIIKTVLTRCAAAVEGGEDLTIEKVELLTKEENPRTKCWKVVVPFRYKGIMEKDEVYPTGWKHRTFFGSRNAREKRPRTDPNSMEQQVLREHQEQQLLEEQQQVEMQHQQSELRIQNLESRMRGGPPGNQTSIA